jgi:hypothetical protein
MEIEKSSKFPLDESPNGLTSAIVAPVRITLTATSSLAVVCFCFLEGRLGAVLDLFFGVLFSASGTAFEEDFDLFF